jgi:hypothetical protein
MHACKTAATVTVTAESATHQSHFTSSLTSAANAVALIVDACLLLKDGNGALQCLLLGNKA